MVHIGAIVQHDEDFSLVAPAAHPLLCCSLSSVVLGDEKQGPRQSHQLGRTRSEDRENCCDTASYRGEEACLGCVHTHSQFEDRLRSWAPQGWPLMRCFTGWNHSQCVFASLDPSYPEGNFEGNQLLGGSIGLSPLCRTQATQFARQNSYRLPPQFPMASS